MTAMTRSSASERCSERKNIEIKQKPRKFRGFFVLLKFEFHITRFYKPEFFENKIEEQRQQSRQNDAEKQRSEPRPAAPVHIKQNLPGRKQSAGAHSRVDSRTVKLENGRRERSAEGGRKCRGNPYLRMSADIAHLEHRCAESLCHERAQKRRRGRTR